MPVFLDRYCESVFSKTPIMSLRLVLASFCSSMFLKIIMEPSAPPPLCVEGSWASSCNGSNGQAYREELDFENPMASWNARRTDFRTFPLHCRPAKGPELFWRLSMIGNKAQQGELGQLGATWGVKAAVCT